MSLRRSRKPKTDGKIDVARGTVRMRRVPEQAPEPVAPEAAEHTTAPAPAPLDLSHDEAIRAVVDAALAAPRLGHDYPTPRALRDAFRRDPEDTPAHSYTQAAARMRFQQPPQYANMHTATTSFGGRRAYRDEPPETLSYATMNSPVPRNVATFDTSMFEARGMLNDPRVSLGVGMTNASLHFAIRHQLGAALAALDEAHGQPEYIISFPICGPEGTPVIIAVAHRGAGMGVFGAAIDLRNMYCFPPVVSRSQPGSRDEIGEVIKLAIMRVTTAQCEMLRQFWRGR